MQDTDDHEDASLSAVTITRHLACTAEDAWAAITEADRIAAWWGDYVSLEARPGGAFREVWRDNDGREVITAGTVETYDPPHRLSLSWKDADWPVATQVTFRIDAADDGVDLTLSHDGWDRFATGGAALRQAHMDGWRHHLDNLSAQLSGARR